MPTVKELLEQLQAEIEAKGIIRNKKLIDAMLSLLSQQSEGVSESDEEAANYYAECCNGGSRGSGIIQQSFLAGRQSLRQQLSQQQQQRSYSEEDMKEAYSHGIEVEAGCSRIFFDEWLTKYNKVAATINQQASIQQGLKEAADIHCGKRAGKTFDEFLNELP